MTSPHLRRGALLLCLSLAACEGNIGGLGTAGPNGRAGAPVLTPGDEIPALTEVPVRPDAEYDPEDPSPGGGMLDALHR